MKRAVIIHCWEGYPEYCWYPWVKKELKEKGFVVTVPQMPETATPNLAKWGAKLKKVIGEPNEELFLIGHSLGCITILRYLESLNGKKQIGGVVFVAGFSDNVGYTELDSFFKTPVNFAKVKERAKGFVAIASDNDPHVPLSYLDVFKQKLGATTITKHAMGHFSGAIEGEESCVELPDVVAVIEKMVSGQ